MTWIIGLILAFVVMVGFLIFAWWGVPILLAAAAVFAFVVLSSRSSAVTVERTSRAPTEPTGTTGAAKGNAETANQRVGQR